jgi:hypothetical protein
MHTWVAVYLRVWSPASSPPWGSACCSRVAPSLGMPVRICWAELWSIHPCKPSFSFQGAASFTLPQVTLLDLEIYFPSFIPANNLR